MPTAGNLLPSKGHFFAPCCAPSQTMQWMGGRDVRREGALPRTISVNSEPPREESMAREDVPVLSKPNGTRPRSNARALFLHWKPYAVQRKWQ
eukprot:3198276-Rhodomonas_salina.2